MHFNIISYGKVKHGFIKEGENHYLKQLTRTTKFSFAELKDPPKGKTQIENKTWCSNELLKNLTQKDFLILLDERGKNYTSQEFAKLLQENMNRGISQFNFAIGAADGWADVAKQRANIVLSLSNLTLAHDLARLVLIEQIYRAINILSGGPYHR